MTQTNNNHNEKIEHLNVNFFQIENHTPEVKSDTLFHIGNWPISNSTLMLSFTLILVLIFSILVKFFFSKEGTPGKFQNLLEKFYEGLESLFEQLSGDKKQAKIIIPTVGSILVFIGLSNFLGLMPGLSSITLDGLHLFRGATSDFNTTFSIALISVIGIQVIGFRQNGFFGYLGHFFKFKEVYFGFKKD